MASADKRAAEVHTSSGANAVDVAGEPPIKRPELTSKLTLQLPPPRLQPRPTSPGADAGGRKRTPSFLRDVYVGDAHSPQVATLNENSKSRRDTLTRKSLQNVLKAQSASTRYTLGGRRLRRRLLARDDYSRQSSGMLNIARKGTDYKLEWLRSPANSLLSLPTSQLLGFFAVSYIICFLVFTPLYMIVNENCGLHLDKVGGSEGREATFTEFFTQAYMLSLETVITIGYGVPDPYYDACAEGTFLLMAHSILGRFLDAVVMACTYVRFTRGTRRGATVVISDKAYIRRKRDQLFFMFQAADQAMDQLIEAHVRMYAIRHADPCGISKAAGPTLFQSFAMRTVHPDDEMGGMLLLALPCLVVHRVDQWSPLMPPVNFKVAAESRGDHMTDFLRPRPTNSYTFPEPIQRQYEAEQGGLDQFPCPVCGECYNTFELFQQHVKAMMCEECESSSDDDNDDDEQQDADNSGSGEEKSSDDDDVSDKQQDIDDSGSGEEKEEEEEKEEGDSSSKPRRRQLSKELSAFSNAAHEHHEEPSPRRNSVRKIDEPQQQEQHRNHTEFFGGKCPTENGMHQWSRPPSQKVLEAFWRSSRLEIVVLIEGIEPITSNTIQSRHSYTVEDMVWDKMPAPCVEEGADGRCVVDFSKFHDYQDPADKDDEDREMWPVVSQI